MNRGLCEVYELLNYTAFYWDIPRKISGRDFEPLKRGIILTKFTRVANSAIFTFLSKRSGKGYDLIE